MGFMGWMEQMKGKVGAIQTQRVRETLSLELEREPQIKAPFNI